MNLTIKAWGGYGVACFVIAFICWAAVMMVKAAMYREEAEKKYVRGIIIGGVVAAACVLFGMNWWYGNTASGKRAWKSQESNLGNGMRREVVIYDMLGKEIKRYSGRFDVTYDNDRILFDDESGLRHVIYYSTGIVVIDELEED